jgi:hypothetical protein
VQINLHNSKIILTFVFIKMELIFVKKETQEWEYIWNYLANHPINEGLTEPKTAYNEGEAWQYMGSYKNGNKIIHDFRHRYHPRTLDVYKITFNASEEFTNEQIDKTIKIK